MASPEARVEAAHLLVAGIQAHEQGDLSIARRHYEAALALTPDQPDALHLLGVITDQEGRHDEAVEMIRRAIALSPQAAAFHGNLGTALLATGDMIGAEAAYRRAVALDASYVEGCVNLGNLMRRKGDNDAALTYYRAALALDDGHVGAHQGLATILMLRKRDAEALPHLVRAVQLAPANADLRDLTGQALRNLKRYAEAVVQHRKAIARAPDNLGFRENYAATLTKISSPESYDDAIREFGAVLAMAPDRVNALVGHGLALVRNRRPVEAMVPLRRALALDGNHVEALVNLSIGLAYMGEFAEALDCCNRALHLAPDDCLVLTHRGTVHEHAGDYEAALADYASAIGAAGNRTPDALAEAQLKHALLLLSLGRFSEGWPRYVARMAAERADPRGRALTQRLPVWDGVVRAGQTILVWGEQGIGDEVIYAAMLPELAARGASFIYACEPRLVDLFRRSFPGIRIVPGGLADLPELAKAADVQIGMGDLGAHLRPTLAAFPPARAYLQPDQNLAAEFRQRYREHGRRLTVGLMWRSKNLFSGMYKSVPLLDWAPLLQRKDILFVNMQYGDTAEERHTVEDQLGVTVLHDDTVDAVNDLDRYAAQAASLDLVISVSNSGLHIAAAVGCPCWVMLPAGIGRLWYWFLDREDSPWYPAVRLFRQPSRGRSDDWASTLARVDAALAARLNEVRG